jgi:hypothetical protein
VLLRPAGYATAFGSAVAAAAWAFYGTRKRVPFRFGREHAAGCGCDCVAKEGWGRVSDAGKKLLPELMLKDLVG